MALWLDLYHGLSSLWKNISKFMEPQSFWPKELKTHSPYFTGTVKLKCSLVFTFNPPDRTVPTSSKVKVQTYLPHDWPCQTCPGYNCEKHGLVEHFDIFPHPNKKQSLKPPTKRDTQKNTKTKAQRMGPSPSCRWMDDSLAGHRRPPLPPSLRRVVTRSRYWRAAAR